MTDTEKGEIAVLTGQIGGMSQQLEKMNDKFDRFIENHTEQREQSIREFSDVKNTVGFICKLSAWGGGILAVVLAALILNFVQDKKSNDSINYPRKTTEQVENLSR